MGEVFEFVPRFSLTVRQREVLRIHAWVCADMAFDDIDEHGDAPVDPTQWWYLFDRLPECTYTRPAVWRRQVARSFDDIASELETAQLPRPRTIAEQLALSIIISQASAALADIDDDDDVAKLPTHPRDNDWAPVCDALMDDRDAEAFYDPATAAAWLQVLSTDTWFMPFEGYAPRDPRRGFRR